MDYLHLSCQVTIVSLAPALIVLYWHASRKGEGWTPLIWGILLSAAVCVVDQNPWSAGVFLLSFLYCFGQAIRDWDRRYYEPKWLRNTPNHDQVLVQLEQPRLPIADAPYRGDHRPEVIIDTGEIPRYFKTI